MIDCKRCHALIDADLAGSLEAKDRSAMATHLRTCHDCVAYKSKRLQDSSILRRPVEELKEVPPPEDPPMPPPRRPSPLPWILTAGALILAMAAGIVLLRDDGADEPFEPRRHRKPPAATSGGEKEPTGGEPVTAPTGPEDPTPKKPAWPILAVMAGGRPVPAASIAVAWSGPTAARRLQTNPAGIAVLRDALRYPLFVTAWAGDRVSKTVRVDEPSGVALELEPGDILEGSLAVESEGAVQGVVASWSGGGRSIGPVDPDGHFRLVVPSPRPALRLRAWSDGDATFRLVPGPPTVSESVTSDVSLRAVRAHRLRIRLSPPTPPPAYAVATASDGRTFALRDATGGVLGLLPTGDYRIEIVRPGLKRFERTLSVTEPTAFTAEFEPSPFSVSGDVTVTPGADVLGDVVIRPVSSSPIAGAALAPWSTTWTTERWWPPWQVGITAPTGADGSFAARAIPWEQVMIEAGDDARFAFGPFSLPAENLRLEIRADAGVSGTVRDGTGSPLAGVEVNLESAGVTRRILTNAEGFYEFSRVVVGPAFVYPRAIVGDFASGRASRIAYQIVTTAGGNQRRDFTLPGVAVADVAITDPQGNAFASSVVITTTDGREVATVAPGSSGPLRLPPLAAGTYLAHLIENEVVFPLGRVALPGRLERVVRRDAPQLEVTCQWGRATAPARAARLIVRRDNEVIGQFIVAIGAAHRIGGLAAGRYAVELRYGAYRAVGIADLVDGRPVSRLTLRLE